MNASLALRWRYADWIVLSALYGRKTANIVLSRPARKPVGKATAPTGIPIPCRHAA